MDQGYVGYVCDIESTGLSPIEHDIIELSMLRMIPKKDSYEEEQKTWLIKAVNPRTISDEALAVNGHKKEDITHLTKFGRDNYKLPKDVFDEIESWMMEDDVSAVDRVFLGQNPTFDLDFLKEFYKRNGKGSEDDFPFMIKNGNKMLDLKQMMILFDLCTGRRRKFYNLSSIVKALGVKKEKAHTADGDVLMTRSCIMKMINMIKSTVIKEFSDCYPENE